MTKALPSKNIRDMTGFKELKSFSVYVNLFSQTKENGITRSVFKIIVEDNISHHKFIGYSFDKSRNSIDIFVDYVLSNLKMKGLLGKKYSIMNRIKVPNQNIPSRSLNRKKKKVIRADIGHKEIIRRIYRELIFNEGYVEIEGYSETKNPILPPIFIDSFLKDMGKMVKFSQFWHDHTMDQNSIRILKDALSDTVCEVDKYCDKFDFENAIKLYNRINNAANEISDSQKLTAGLLLKRVKIYFHLEQYDKCRELIENNLKEFERHKLKKELGEFYYYLGMIFSYENKNREADICLSKSSRLLTYSSEPLKTFIYYLSRIRRYILKNNFNQAVVLVNRAIRYLSESDLFKELAYLYGIKAEVFYREGKYSYALDNIDLQLDNAKCAKDLVTESKAIAQMFLVRSYWGKTDEDTASGYLKRIRKLSRIIKKNSYYYDALINLGVLYYRKDMNEISEKYFERARRIYTVNTKDAASHIVNMVYLSKIRINTGKYLSAVRLLNRMQRLCMSKGIGVYPAYIENSLGKIYFKTCRFLKSNKHMKKAVKYIKQENIADSLLLAHSLRYMGKNYYELKMKEKSADSLICAKELYEKLHQDNAAWSGKALKEIDSLLDRLG